MTEIKMELPASVTMIIEKLQGAGFEAYAVGGCVRDTILGRKPQDWDITTSALPEQVKELFSHTIDTGIAHGTVTVMIKKEGFEVTTYRIDGEYEDARHPKEVTFTGNLLEDLKRRDFTINAMAYNETQGIVDAFDGIGDLKRGVIRCVGNPLERFSEDALRMLRAVRFAAQLGFSIEEKTKAAVKELAPTLEKISAERIQVELVKLLVSAHPEEIKTVYELGLTKIFLPEFDAMMETTQNTPHHSFSVGEHTIHALCGVSPDKVLRLTMLLHDVAKPECKRTDENGRDHFYGHPQRGSQMAREILRRLKFDNDTTSKVCRFILYHDDRPSCNQKEIRKAISRIGVDLYPQLFEVKRADTLAQSTYEREKKISYIEEYEQLYHRILETQECVEKKNMAVSGKDLLSIGMKPGKQMGELLEALYEHVLEKPEDNQKEILLGIAKKEFEK